MSVWTASNRDKVNALGRRAHHLPAVAVLVIVSFLAYGGSLRHGFVWDDVGLILDNPHLKSGGEFTTPFVRSFWSLTENEPDPTRSFYRPLISVSYALDHAGDLALPLRRSNSQTNGRTASLRNTGR
ncbi:hypothetical protein ACFLSJ_05370 [Verrucomicrobiota bacterium]